MERSRKRVSGFNNYHLVGSLVTSSPPLFLSKPWTAYHGLGEFRRTSQGEPLLRDQERMRESAPRSRAGGCCPVGAVPIRGVVPPLPGEHAVSPPEVCLPRTCIRAFISAHFQKAGSSWRGGDNNASSSSESVGPVISLWG